MRKAFGDGENEVREDSVVTRHKPYPCGLSGNRIKLRYGTLRIKKADVKELPFKAI
jgi:hypothetical protein